jgi:hypothetical protein
LIEDARPADRKVWVMFDVPGGDAVDVAVADLL